jgi:hypothetical protein
VILRPRRLARRALQTTLLGVVLALVAFHAILLWSHALAGRLSDPAVALRWLASIGIVGLFVLLRRNGVPVLWGRRALVLWLLVALLHASAARPAVSSTLAELSPVDAALALFVVPAAGVLFAAGMALLRFMRRRAVARSVRPPSGRPPRQRPPSICHALQRLAPRAPPLAIS